MSTDFSCHACGAPLGLTPQYMAQYGGQVTNCPNCGAAFTIPPAPMMAPPHGGPVGVISYAGPRPRYGGGMWTDGRDLICYSGAEGPDRCVKCDAPADGWRWRRTLYWHHPALFLMILFPGLLIYAIVALCVRKKALVTVSLCKQHRASRINAMLVGWLGALVVAPGVIVAGLFLADHYRADELMPVAILLGIAGFLFSIIWASFRAPPVRARRIDDQVAYLIGAKEPFLRNLDRP